MTWLDDLLSASVQKAGTIVGQRRTLNLSAQFLVTDDPANNRLNISLDPASLPGGSILTGTADAVQLSVKAFSTQTSDLQRWLKSDGTVLISVSGDGANLTWGPSAPGPTIYQQQHPTTHGQGMFFAAQSGATGAFNGGILHLSGGTRGNGSALKGGVRLQLNTTAENMLEAVEVAVGRRVLSLCRTANITTTEMPTNTGDLVMFIGDAATAPTAAPGAGGVIHWSTSGKPRWRNTTGTFGFDCDVSATASAGGGQAVPATVENYILVNIGGATKKMPYFAV